jgi:AAHS family 4-hydroxybenzoate transporter-like MFS transporter
MPNAAALAAEYVPLRQRPIAVTVTIVCVPLGGTLAGLLGIRVLPLIGWRMLFVLGGVIPIAGAALFYFLMPESPRYLARQRGRWRELVRVLARMGHQVPADSTFSDESGRVGERASMRSLFAPEFRRDTLALFGAFFSCLLAVYIGFSWLTSLLTGAGFDPGTANTGITAFNLGGVVGALVGGVAIARFGSRVSMLIMAGGGIAGAAGLATMTIASTSPVLPIVAMLAFTGAAINATQTTMYALAAHVYPTLMRATGVGTAVSFGRIGAVLSGYAGAGALEWGGSPAYFGLIAAAMCTTFVALALVGRHVPRRTAPGT